jgi:hypothetical protein
LANATGFLSNTNNLQFTTSNNALIVNGHIVTNNIINSGTINVSSNGHTTSFVDDGKLILPGELQFSDSSIQTTAFVGTAVDAFARTNSNSAFEVANNALSNGSAASSYANAAFTAANTSLSNDVNTGSYANAAFLKANSAYQSQNVTGTYANNAYVQANNAISNAFGASQYANAAFGVANTALHTSTSASSYANSAFAVANAAGSNVTLTAAFTQANASFATANSKTYIFYQSTAPTTANARDEWVNSDSGVKYQNISGTTPLWVELGPTTAVTESPIAQGAYDKANTAITTSGGSITGNLSVSGTISIDSKQAVNGPAFRAYITTGQAIPSAGAQVKVTFGGETFDTNGNFSSSRFTPTVEGYYQINATVRLAGTSGTGENMLVIYKNGGEYARGTNGSGTEIGANFYSMQVSDLVYANGTTDYFEIYIQQGSGSNRDTTAGTNISYFSGVMVRGA